jgi:hypothetical protein
MLPPFKDWRYFKREWNKLWRKYVTEYPCILLSFDLLTEDEKELTLQVFPALWRDQEQLIKRLPPDPDRKHPSERRIKRPKGRASMPWENEITDIGLPVEPDDRYKLFDNFKDSFIEKYCLECGKYKCCQPKYSRSVIVFLEKRDPSYIAKFKYRDYCSDECKKKSRNKRRRKLKSSRVCPYCKKEYEGYGRTCQKSWCKKRAYREESNSILFNHLPEAFNIFN